MLDTFMEGATLWGVVMKIMRYGDQLQSKLSLVL